MTCNELAEHQLGGWCFSLRIFQERKNPMYVVNDAFLTAIKKNTSRYYWTGKITAAGDGYLGL